jgi:hypothetical protein
MLHALLSGKLSRDQENMEDLLTSVVFGSLKYVAPEVGLLRWLALGETINGSRPLADFENRVAVDYEFWPRWGEPGCIGCEPDVVLRVSSQEQNTLIAIEAKYWSGKSSLAGEDGLDTPPNDQLAREWDNLRRRAASEGARPILIYVTAGYLIPKQELQESLDDYQKRRPTDEVSPLFCWLTWRSLSELFGRADQPVLSDVTTLARRLDLTFFEGVTLDNQPPNVTWHFHGGDASIQERLLLSWTAFQPLAELTWSFSP